MPDYQQMYALLFREITKAIDTLQRAQQATEALYIEGDEPEDSPRGMRLLDGPNIKKHQRKPHP